MRVSHYKSMNWFNYIMHHPQNKTNDVILLPAVSQNLLLLAHLTVIMIVLHQRSSSRELTLRGSVSKEFIQLDVMPGQEWPCLELIKRSWNQHSSNKILSKQRNRVISFDFMSVNKTCTSCQSGKSRKLPFTRPQHQSCAPLASIYCNVWGTFSYFVCSRMSVLLSICGGL